MSVHRAPPVSFLPKAKVGRAGGIDPTHDKHPSGSTMVRCRGCRKFVKVSKAVHIGHRLPRDDPGSAWACRPCLATAINAEG